MEFGERLKRLRRKNGLSLYRLAQRAGVSHSFLHALENGEKSPTLRTLEKICRGLGIDPADFFGPTQSPGQVPIPRHLWPLVQAAMQLSPAQVRSLTHFIDSLQDSESAFAQSAATGDDSDES